jgi:hypothetical protein
MRDTDQMKQLAYITIGNSDFDPRLWKLLEDSGVDRDDFESLDYFSMLPFFVLAGASVDTQVESHGDHFHFQGVRVVIPEDMEEPFFAALPQLLAQLEDDDEED